MCVHGIPAIPSDEFPPSMTQTKSFAFKAAAVGINLAAFETESQASTPQNSFEFPPWGQFDSVQSMLCTWRN